MKKKAILSFLSFIVLFSLIHSRVEAANCGFSSIPDSPIAVKDVAEINGEKIITLKFNPDEVAKELKSKKQSGVPIAPNGMLKFYFPQTIINCSQPISDVENYDIKNNDAEDYIYKIDLARSYIPVTCNYALTTTEYDYQVIIAYEYYTAGIKNLDNICEGSYKISSDKPFCREINITPSGIGDITNNWTVKFLGIRFADYIGYAIGLDDKWIVEPSLKWPINTEDYTYPDPINNLSPGSHTIYLYAVRCPIDGFTKKPHCTLDKKFLMCSKDFYVGDKDTPAPQPTPTAPLSAECQKCARSQYKCSGTCFTCPGCEGENISTDLKPICEALPTDFQVKCKDCQKTDSKTIWTAIGCMPISATGFVKQYIFTYGVGIAGGFAFLYFLFAAFTILTSAGNPEKIEEAKQMIVSSLSGLLLIIFSVVILKTIGVDILQIPGWSTTAPTPTSMHIPPGGLYSPTPSPRPTTPHGIPTEPPTPTLFQYCSGPCVLPTYTCPSGYHYNTTKLCSTSDTRKGLTKCCELVPTSTPTLTPTPTIIPNTCEEYQNSTDQPCPKFSTKTSLDGTKILTFNQQCGTDNKCKYFCYEGKENPQLELCYPRQTLDSSFLNTCKNDITNPSITASCPASYQGKCVNDESCTFYRECGYQNDIYTDTNGWCQYFCYSNLNGKHIPCWSGQF